MKKNNIGTFDVGGIEKGFFCMKLVEFLRKEKESKQLTDEKFQILWHERFKEARIGNCSYRKLCPVYKATLESLHSQ